MPLIGQPLIRPAEFHYQRGEVEPEHQHSEHQLMYTSEGLLSVDTATARWVVPPLRAVWIPGETPHSVTAEAASQMSTLYFRGDMAIAGLDRLTVISVSPLLRELILHMVRSPLGEAQRERLDGVMIDQLAADPAAPLELPRFSDPRLRAVAAIFERDPRDGRSLREIGSAVGASERTLQRLFDGEIGTSFGRWRTQLRLQNGVVELGKGSTVTAAAARSGYAETSSFIEAFRSAFGTTPGRYFAG